MKTLITIIGLLILTSCAMVNTASLDHKKEYIHLSVYIDYDKNIIINDLGGILVTSKEHLTFIWYLDTISFYNCSKSPKQSRIQISKCDVNVGGYKLMALVKVSVRGKPRIFTLYIQDPVYYSKKYTFIEKYQ